MPASAGKRVGGIPTAVGGGRRPTGRAPKRKNSARPSSAASSKVTRNAFDGYEVFSGYPNSSGRSSAFRSGFRPDHQRGQQQHNRQHQAQIGNQPPHDDRHAGDHVPHAAWNQVVRVVSDMADRERVADLLRQRGASATPEIGVLPKTNCPPLFVMVAVSADPI